MTATLDETVKRVSTRSVYQALELFENTVELEKDVLVCLPLWGWLVARSFLVDYGFRATSYAMEYTKAGYRTPNEEQFDKIDELISKTLGADIMCVDDIIVALDGIAESIAAKESCSTCGGTGGSCGCDDGSGGAGSSEGGLGEFIDDGSSSFPELFDNRADYLEKKCSIARLIVAQMISDLEKIKIVGITTITIEAFAAAMFTPIPGARILALLAVLVVLTVSGLMLGIIIDVIDELEEKEEQLICALMAASGTQDAKDAFFDVLGLGGAERSLIEFWVTNDSFFRLFNYGDVEGGFGNCSSCDDGWCDILVLSGTIQSEVVGQQIVILSEATVGAEHVQVLLNKSSCPGVSCGDVPIVTFERVGHSPNPSTTDFQFFIVDDDCNTTSTCYTSDAVPADNTAGSCVANKLRFVSADTVPMTVTINFQSNQ